MGLSSQQVEIHKQSGKCVAELDKRNGDFENAVSDFLRSNHNNYLIVETKDLQLGAIGIMQVVRHLKEDREIEAWDRYLDAKNQIFLHWDQLLDIAGKTEELPRFTDLLVCMFPDCESVKIEEEAVLYKIRDRLKIAVFKKIVFITSRQNLLDDYLREIDTSVTSGNKVPSKIYVGERALLDRASCGDVIGVKELLENGVDVNATGYDAFTPLHFAAQEGHKKVVVTLLHNGAKHLTNMYGYTPLHTAAANGHLDVLLTLLRYGGDMSRNKSGDTPLHTAAANGHLDVLLTLLRYGGDMSRNKSGDTPLHTAAKNGHSDIVRALLENDVRIDIDGGEGQTALLDAVDNGRKNVIQTLLNYGADVNARSRNTVPLHCAAKYMRTGVVQMLLENGADIHIVDDSGNSVLHVAAEKDYNNVVETLLNYGANKEALDGLGRTPLHVAASNNCLDVVSTLLANGAHVNANDGTKSTPLHNAVLIRNLKIVEVLIEEGAAIRVKNGEGKTPMNLAFQVGDTRIAALLQHKINTRY